MKKQQKPKKLEVMSAVLMQHLGIRAVVLTQQDRLEELREEFLTAPDQAWMDGDGKVALREHLAAELKAEDDYFDAFLLRATTDNPRWTNFMDTCVIYAVLCSVLDDEPLLLMHPSCWEGSVSKSQNNAQISSKPTLVNGVPTSPASNH